MMKKCWRCGIEVQVLYANGMCEDCYRVCEHANEVDRSMTKDFKDGELSGDEWDKEYERRLKND